MAIFGITGSILVFHAEIDELLSPALLTVEQPTDHAGYKPLTDILEAGRKAMPTLAKLTFATYPRNDRAAFRLFYTLTSALDLGENWQVYVNPYTTKVTGKRLMNTSDSLLPNTFINFIFKLHYSLLIKPHDVSRVVVGLVRRLIDNLGANRLDSLVAVDRALAAGLDRQVQVRQRPLQL